MPMKFPKLILALAVLLLALVLTRCGEQVMPEADPTATAYAYPPPMNDPDEVAASLTAIPEEEETAAPTEEAPETEPTEAVAEEPAVDNCVECHTDQQALVDTANPVEEVTSENEGEG